MKYSKLRFTGVFSTATVATVALIFLVVSSQVAVAVLPVVGIGGLLLTADEFTGQDATVYPEKGQLENAPDSVTDTVACEERPMLVFDLQGASAQNFALYKDIQVPYFTDQWATIKIVETNGGSLDANNVQIYTTQLEASSLNITNIRLAEAGPNPNVRSTEKFGPNSGEFILQGDPESTATQGDNLVSKDIKTWVHAITGQSVVIQGDTGGLVNIELDYVTTADIQNRYDNIGMDTAEISNRENYFDCLPGT